MDQFDVDFARAQFPQFRDPDSAQWAFFENAGGAYAPDPVINALDSFYRGTKLQPYYPYEPSLRAGEKMDRGIARIAELINALPEEIHLGPSTTSNVYFLADALAHEMNVGDEIIVTDLDHEANIGAWRRLAKRGIVVREWQCNARTGELELAVLDRLLGDRTKLVCVTHCSNVIGAVVPIEQVIERCHRAGARVVVDGVSHAPHAPIDVRAMNVDFYLFSLYKVFGPHQGLLFTRSDHLERVINLGHFFNAGLANKRLTPAGPNHGEVMACAGVTDYLDQLVAHHGNGESAEGFGRFKRLFGLISAHEENLMMPLRQWLAERRDVRIVGAAEIGEDRAPIVTFVCAHKTGAEIVGSLSEGKVGAAHGHFYAYRLFQRLGLDPKAGGVRVSMAHYNTAREVQRLIEALDRAL